MIDKLKRGFTLVEMMVVIGIIGVLGSLLLPNVTKMLGKAKIAGSQGVVNSTLTSLLAYSDDNGDYPIVWGASASWVLRDYLREYATFTRWGSFLMDSWQRWMSYHPPTCWGIVGAIYSHGPDGGNDTWSCDWWRYWGFANDDIGRSVRRE